MALPTIDQMWDKVQGAKQGMEAGQEAYKEYAGTATALEPMLKSELMKRGPSTELRQTENQMTSELQKSPSEIATGEFAPEVTNPLIRAKYAASRDANLRQGIKDVQAIRQETEGSILDIITAATAKAKANEERLKTELDFRANGYEMALKEYGLVSEAEAATKAEEWKQKEFDEQTRQFNETMTFNREELAAQNWRASLGSGSETSDQEIDSYAQALFNGDISIEDLSSIPAEVRGEALKRFYKLQQSVKSETSQPQNTTTPSSSSPITAKSVGSYINKTTKENIAKASNIPNTIGSFLSGLFGK